MTSASGYEIRMYNDISNIYRELKELNRSMAKIAEAATRVAEELQRLETSEPLDTGGDQGLR